jgi:hypothetical protein
MFNPGILDNGKNPLQREIAMKTEAKESKRSLSAKITSVSIVALVVAGTLFISGIVDVSEGSGMMSRVFFFFLGAIIVVQIIPCLMLLGAMLKAIASFFGKKAKATNHK